VGRASYKFGIGGIFKVKGTIRQLWCCQKKKNDASLFWGQREWRAHLLKTPPQDPDDNGKTNENHISSTKGGLISKRAGVAFHYQDNKNFSSFGGSSYINSYLTNYEQRKSENDKQDLGLYGNHYMKTTTLICWIWDNTLVCWICPNSPTSL
jgi:hypothetical protein